MPGLSKQQALADLRARIETIEKRPPLAEPHRVLASESRFALPSGQLHEIFTDTQRHAAASLGFALGASRNMLSSERPALLYLQLRKETQEAGLPYGSGLAAFGIDPEAIILIRPETIVELLWAAEEALGCKAVAAVVADIGSDPRVLDFTVSRRLGMRAIENGTTILLLRYGLGRMASAARLRWHLRPELSGNVPFDPREPGESRWRLTLEKGLVEGKPNGEWILSWTKNGFDLVDVPDADRVARTTTLPRPLSAALGDRLSKTA